MALIGLYSGRKIKELAKKRKRLTRTQTASQAKRAIEKKYKGGIVDSALYYHNGGGNWIRHSKTRDAQRTGKVTSDIKEWRKRPHELDYKGVDTKGGYSSRGPYFGKDLSKGKYSPKINTKRNVLLILKKRYPKTQFIVLGEWGYKNVGVIWTGGPTVKTLEKLDMARGLSKRRDWVLGIDVDFRRKSKKEFLTSLDAFVKNKDRRASSKASTTLPMSAVKQAKPEDLSKYIKLFRQYMHACNIKQINGEIVITCVDKPGAIQGVKMYLSDTGNKNYEKAGNVIIVGGPSVSFKTKPPLAKFEGKYKDFIYKVDTKKGIITFSHPKLTGAGDYTTGPTYYNVNTYLKKDIVELAERMINKTLVRITRQLAPAQLSQMEVGKAARSVKPSSMKAEHNKYFIPKRDELPLIKQFRKSYSAWARVGYVPFSSGLIIYHDEIPAGAIVLQDRKTGLYFIMFIYPDGTKTAKISKNYNLRTKYSKKEVIKELGEWEKRTGNIT